MKKPCLAMLSLLAASPVAPLAADPVADFYKG